MGNGEFRRWRGDSARITGSCNSPSSSPLKTKSQMVPMPKGQAQPQVKNKTLMLLATNCNYNDGRHAGERTGPEAFRLDGCPHRGADEEMFQHGINGSEIKACHGEWSRKISWWAIKIRRVASWMRIGHIFNQNSLQFLDLARPA